MFIAFLSQLLAFGLPVSNLPERKIYPLNNNLYGTYRILNPVPSILSIQEEKSMKKKYIYSASRSSRIEKRANDDTSRGHFLSRFHELTLRGK
jgi:hypothetical protein